MLSQSLLIQQILLPETLSSIYVTMQQELSYRKQIARQLHKH